MKRRCNLIQSEGGQILIVVIIILMLAAIAMPAILGLTYSSGKKTNINTQKTQVRYAADSGIQDALNRLANLGNGTLQVPDYSSSKNGNGTLVIEGDWVGYTLGAPAPVSVNDCQVDMRIEYEGNGTGHPTYLITSTGDSTIDPTVTIQARAKLLTVPGTYYTPGEGCNYTSAFDYAVASLGPTGPDFKTNPVTISGNVYSNGPVDFGAGSTVTPDGYHKGDVWANGPVTLEYSISKGSVSISGSVHANGDIKMIGYGPTDANYGSIGGDAYGNGSIQATGVGSWIGGSAWASEDINVGLNTHGSEVAGSGIAHSAVALGDVHVSGPVINGLLWNVGGNVASNGDVTVDNAGTIMGDVNVSPDGTVTHSNGIINGDITYGTVTLTLPEIPTLVATDVAWWQNYYYTQATTGPDHVTYPGGYTIPQGSGNVSMGNTYIVGDFDVKNGNTVYLGNDTTVYVTGLVMIDSASNVMGTGRLVAVGDITLKNKIVGDPIFMPLLMTLGCLQVFNQQASDPGTLYAALYAPNCNVDLKNWNIVSGAVVAQGITGGQGTNIIWNPGVRNIPGLPGGDVTDCETEWTSNTLTEMPGVLIDYYKVCDTETCD